TLTGLKCFGKRLDIDFVLISHDVSLPFSVKCRKRHRTLNTTHFGGAQPAAIIGNHAFYTEIAKASASRVRAGPASGAAPWSVFKHSIYNVLSVYGDRGTGVTAYLSKEHSNEALSTNSNK
ncbi:hypothetical protein, partial [Marinobacterium arenosum]|uniref:hypothetical protein n=1 Tax=Marinobacterium arenosum TaxID=2862496 RepID=UPI001C94F51A